MQVKGNARIRALSALWQNPLMGLAIVDPVHETLLDANDAFLTLLEDCPRNKTLPGTPLSGCFPDDKARGLRQAMQEALRTDTVIIIDGESLRCMALPVQPGEAAEVLLLTELGSEPALAASGKFDLVDLRTRYALVREFHLSGREIDTIRECLLGKRNGEIAQQLHINVTTVKRHLASAYRKIGIRSARSLPLTIVRISRGAARSADPAPPPARHVAAA